MAATICWYCEKRYGNCSWSKDFTPVEGWTAKERLVNDKYRGHSYISYRVMRCPLFIMDRPKCMLTQEAPK